MLIGFLFVTLTTICVVISFYVTTGFMIDHRAVSMRVSGFKELTRIRPAIPASLENHIPTIVYKTGPKDLSDLPITLIESFRKIERENPPFRVEYYSDARALSFLIDYHAPLVKAYRSIVPGSFRADLLRYALLYSFGGLYSDLTQEFMFSFNQIIDLRADELVLVKDRESNNPRCDFTGVQISFMAARKQQKVFRVALDMILQRVRDRDYGCGMLDVTGPKLFRRALETTRPHFRMELEQSASKNEILWMHPGEFAGQVAIVTKSADHDQVIGKTDENSYVNLYKWRAIFKD